MKVNDVDIMTGRYTFPGARLPSALLALILTSCRADIPPAVSQGTPNVVYSTLQGHISGTLTASGSPYKAVGTLIVDSLTVLTLDAGVTIFFDDTSELVVGGTLACTGSSVVPVTFTTSASWWRGIEILGSSQSSVLQFAVVESVDVSTGDTPDRNGAVEITGASVVIRNSIFHDNWANNGGALSLDSTQSVVTNCLFIRNSASNFGAAIVSFGSSNSIINNTFFENTTINFGGAVVLAGPVSEDVQNNIFYLNSDGSGDPALALYQADSTHVRAQYNFLQTGNQNPQFISATDLHLSALSPCINAGNPAPQFNDVDGTRNDQGAYGGPAGNW